MSECLMFNELNIMKTNIKNMFSESRSYSDVSLDRRLTVGSPSGFNHSALLKVVAVLVMIFTLGIGQMWGATETYTYSDYTGQGTPSSGSDYTMTKTYSSIGDTKFNGGATYGQFFAGGVTTITPLSSATITSVVLTATSSSYNGYQSSGTVTASAGTVTKTNNTTVTWTGSRTTAFTISHSKQIRWTSIVVTYTAAASTYTVSYDANGGTGTMTDSNSPYNSGATVTVLSNSFTAPDGYKFDHWNTAANDGGTDYDPTDQFTISANTTLYAQWAAKSLTNYRTSCSSTPTLSVDPNSLNFGNVAVNSSNDLTFTLNGSNLTADATVAVSGAGYSVDPSSVSKVGTSITNATITVTYHPTTTGDNQAGTVTVTSGAASTTVSLTGNSKTAYSVTCSAASNGSVSSDKATAIAGETVTLTITPSSGYQLSTISANSGAVTLDGTGNTRTFTMPAGNVTVTSSFVLQTDYVLVTNVSELNDGDLITLCTVEGNNAEGYILDEQNSNNRARKSITTGADGKIAESDVAYPIVLESVVGGWKLKDQTNSNNYLYATYNQNYLKNAADPSNSVWTIAVNTTTHKATITTEAYNNNDQHDTRYIQHNASSSCFSAYKNTMVDCYIYKKELGCDKLAAPGGLSVTSKGTTTCTLNWNSVANASGYDVSLDNGSSWITGITNLYYDVVAGDGWTAGSTHTWKVRATGTGDYCPKGNAASNEVTMLHVYTVTYDANGGSGTLPVAGGVVNVTEGGSHVVLGNTGNGGGAVLTKAGYTFANWHSSSSYSASPAYTVASTISNITSNMTLYANWAPKTDTYIDGVHGNSDKTGSGVYNAPAALPDETRATSGDCETTHFKFIGWVEESDFNTNGSSATIIAPGTSMTATNATYYAVWGEEL